MTEFFASETSLILGIALIAIAAIDYVALKFFWHALNPANDPRLNKIRELGAYWVAIFIAAGLFFIVEHFRFRPNA